MNAADKTPEELASENEHLSERLFAAEEMVRAISKGEVDAFLIQREAGDQVFVLDGSDRPYRLLIERMQQGTASLSRDGTIIYANRRMAELLATPLANIVGSPIEKFVAENELPAIRRLLEQGQTGDAEAEVCMQRDDKKFPAYITVSPLLEQGGVICAIITDLTQQKRLEHEREKLVEEQAARAAAENAAAVLREANRRKDEFLAMLAHELRNPLAPIRNSLQILRMEPNEPAPAELIEIMERQANHLVRLVDDLLDVSRITRGKIQLQRKPADLGDILRDALETSRPLINEAGHRIHVSLPDSPLILNCDPMRIAQVFANLLNNAAKYTVESGDIWLSAHREGNEAVVTVRDSGIGITEDMLSKVFDLFAQNDRSLGRSQGGLGVGLTIVRRLVEMHGGTVEAESAGKGQGSEFRVHLPLDASAMPAPEPDEKPTTPAAEPTRTRILLVDDYEDSARTLGMLLEFIGMEVQIVHSGQAALDALESYTPEVVLLDLGMPGMDGFEVARRIRQMPQYQDLKLIALTGWGQPEDVRRSQEAGFNHHLTKPVKLTTLEALLLGIEPPEDE